MATYNVLGTVPCVEASGAGPGPPESVGCPLGFVPADIPDPVQASRPLVPPAALLPVVLLVTALRDGVLDLPASQVAAFATRAASLVNAFRSKLSGTERCPVRAVPCEGESCSTRDAQTGEWQQQ
ncbi:hypothetical protein GCM10015536_76850 [Streptomyces griseomycini]|nr:hypothetical protein GCM10015536_76850 [Streptomyces griseomycini]